MVFSSYNNFFIIFLLDTRKLLLHFAIFCGTTYGTPMNIRVSSPECVTASDSKVPDTPCVFSFTHEGVLYEVCLTDPVNKTRRWCSTKTDENGIHVMENCGFCSGNCPVQLGLA